MVPQLMPEVFHIFQVGVEKPHQLYDGMCITLSFFFILQRHQVFDHLLDMTPVFTHNKVISRRIVFHVFHVFYFVKTTRKTADSQWVNLHILCWYNVYHGSDR